MLSLLLYALLAIVAVIALFAVAVLVLPPGTQIASAATDQVPVQVLPDRALAAAEVADIRLPVALRGYRFAETDLLLDRLAHEVRIRDEELAHLRAPQIDAKIEEPVEAPAEPSVPTSVERPIDLVPDAAED